MQRTLVCYFSHCLWNGFSYYEGLVDYVSDIGLSAVDKAVELAKEMTPSGSYSLASSPAEHS